MLTSCTKQEYGLTKIGWKECDSDHFGTPLVAESFDQYAGVEIILTAQSRYLPSCGCQPEDWGDWNKLTGVAWSSSSERNSILLGWRYDGQHVLAPYIHDDWRGQELNPDFCGLPKVVVQEYVSYYFLTRLRPDRLEYFLVNGELLFSGVLESVMDYPCRRAYFTHNSPGRIVNAYFGGQCRPQESSFYRRILSAAETKKRIERL